VATVGVDVGGTKCLAVVLDGDRVGGERRVSTPTEPAALLDAVTALVADVSGTAEIAAVGVGAPGLVDAAGVLRFAPNLPGIVGLPLKAELERRLGVPVQADNDATCAAWGEHHVGAAKGLDEVVLVTLGTGIGGGIVTGGRISRGANGFAGEVGHMVVDPAGPPCLCGRHGCWERFASGTGLGALGREAALAGRASRVAELAGGDPDGVRGEHVTAAAAEGDAEAVAVMARLAWWVALGLYNLANAFDPEAFVVGGGLAEAGDVLFDPVRTAFAELVGGYRRPVIDILPAVLGEHAGAIGAASLAADFLVDGREKPACPDVVER
jgi:glucokinase